MAGRDPQGMSVAEYLGMGLERLQAHKRPTNKQRCVLEVLEAGGHIERVPCQVGATLVPVDGPQRKLQDSTYYAMQDHGWLWQAGPNIWRITGRGSAVVAARRAR